MHTRRRLSVAPALLASLVPTYASQDLRAARRWLLQTTSR
jgi:hypothetical protein